MGVRRVDERDTRLTYLDGVALQIAQFLGYRCRVSHNRRRIRKGPGFKQTLLIRLETTNYTG